MNRWGGGGEGALNHLPLLSCKSVYSLSTLNLDLSRLPFVLGQSSRYVLIYPELVCYGVRSKFLFGGGGAGGGEEEVGGWGGVVTVKDDGSGDGTSSKTS